MRRYAALRRTVCADHRIHEAVRFQGFMLRALGVRKRAMQRKMLQGLNFIGLNPVSFDSRVHLLLLETLQEGIEFCRSATQKLLSLIEKGYCISFLTLLNKSSIFGIYESSLLVSMQRSALVRKELLNEMFLRCSSTRQCGSLIMNILLPATRVLLFASTRITM